MELSKNTDVCNGCTTLKFNSKFSIEYNCNDNERSVISLFLLLDGETPQCWNKKKEEEAIKKRERQRNTKR